MDFLDIKIFAIKEFHLQLKTGVRSNSFILAIFARRLSIYLNHLFRAISHIHTHMVIALMKM